MLQGWATSGFNLNSGFLGVGKYCIFLSNSRLISSLQVFWVFFTCTPSLMLDLVGIMCSIGICEKHEALAIFASFQRYLQVHFTVV